MRTVVKQAVLLIIKRVFVLVLKLINLSSHYLLCYFYNSSMILGVYVYMQIDNVKDLLMTDTVDYISSKVFSNNSVAQNIMNSDATLPMKVVNICLVKLVDKITGETRRDIAKKDLISGILTKEEYNYIVSQIDQEAIEQKTKVSNIIRSVMELIFPSNK